VKLTEEFSAFSLSLIAEDDSFHMPRNKYAAIVLVLLTSSRPQMPDIQMEIGSFITSSKGDTYYIWHR
jgi:hypothetical protein